MWKWLTSRIRLAIVSADCVMMLNALQKAEILLEDITYINDLELQITISKKDMQKAREICKKYGASLKNIEKTGIYWLVLSLWKRPVLITFICVLCLIFIYLPSRVLFVCVTGNSTVSTNQILEAAENCGVVFGASRRQVRSEKMKNALLQEIPELQWAGINTSGCTAVISVREKTTQEMKSGQKSQVSSIVAIRDGVIQNCTVFKGNALCKVGQAVKAGQTLVSGYLDCGIVTKTTQADAEIKALTFRELEVFSPTPDRVRGNQISKSTAYSLKIGKKRINFYKDSGNYDTSCAKIYEEKFLQFPGGFCLPIALVKETTISYDTILEIPSSADAWMVDFAEIHLQDTMVAGEIVSKDIQVNQMDGVCYLYGRYACLEMIGQVKYEQTIVKDE